MRLALLSAALLLLPIAAPAVALPQCYADFGNGIVDLSAMCGQSKPVAPTAVAPVAAPTECDRVVARSSNFEARGGSLTGIVFNFCDRDVANVVIKATGYQEGHNPQVQTIRLARIGADNNVPALASFDLELETWTTEVISFDLL